MSAQVQERWQRDVEVAGSRRACRDGGGGASACSMRRRGGRCRRGETRDRFRWMQKVAVALGRISKDVLLSDEEEPERSGV